MNSSSSQGSSSRSARSASRVGSLDMDAYTLIKSSYPVEWDYGGDPIMCFCHKIAPRWTSWTNGNPGRRFYGCPKFLEGKPYCKKFHVWHDESFPDRAKEVILELKDREKLLFNEARFWKNQAKMVRQSAVDYVEAELIEENALLKQECGYLRSKLQDGKRWKWGKMSFVVGFIFYAVSLFKM
ncbi:Zinc finger, GRF-type [Corchorus olitorius]|uniref:Zinc finger, GRF-type n=1 Tax=Corchorus olitorius TaxID=93759 RepID=A0A1R3HQU9_9ROSI|nr:Zinc finger, GRF-type [Corchorus olitorius]